MNARITMLGLVSGFLLCGGWIGVSAAPSAGASFVEIKLNDGQPEKTFSVVNQTPLELLEGSLQQTFTIEMIEAGDKHPIALRSQVRVDYSLNEDEVGHRALNPIRISGVTPTGEAFDFSNVEPQFRTMELKSYGSILPIYCARLSDDEILAGLVVSSVCLSESVSG